MEVIFRVHRDQVPLMLEPIRDIDTVTLHEGDEFVTGTLNTDPWEEVLTAVRDLPADQDGNRRTGA